MKEIPTAFALACGLVLADAAGAGAQPESAASEAAPDWSLPTHVQLSPDMLPVEGRKYGGIPITIYLKPFDNEQLGAICRKSSRIRDALLGELYSNPIPRKGKYAYDLEGTAQRLLDPINRALGARVIERIYMLLGAHSFGGGAVTKLPFGNASGCRGIKDLEAKRMREQAK